MNKQILLIIQIILLISFSSIMSNKLFLKNENEIQNNQRNKNIIYWGKYMSIKNKDKLI